MGSRGCGFTAASSPTRPCSTGLTFDLAALENGGDIVACSDQFYSVPRNAISPGLSRVMGEGWETRRRRAPGNEWLVAALAARSVIALAEIDTSGYIGNSPGAVRLRGLDAPDAGSALASRVNTDAAEADWFVLLPVTALLPDTPHRFRLAAVPAGHRGAAGRVSRRRHRAAAAARLADR